MATFWQASRHSSCLEGDLPMTATTGAEVLARQVRNEGVEDLFI
jgi:hypothetical protein